MGSGDEMVSWPERERLMPMGWRPPPRTLAFWERVSPGVCGPDDECEAVFCGFYAVVFKWAALSAAVAAESGHSEVEVECGVFFEGSL